MAWIKEAKADNAAGHARRAFAEGHHIFVYQFRGSFGHSPSLSRPIADVSEQIEAVEANGWYLDKMDSLIYDKNMTVVCLFRRRQGQ